MGGWYEETHVEAKDERELMEKWNEVVAEARYEHGHGGYSGSFAEKSNLVVIRKVGNPIREEQAYKHCVDENDKWGPAFAYYLGEGRWYIGGWCSS